MSRHGWLGSRMGILGVGLCLWIGVPERAEAFQIFAASEVQEAHTLRQRILTEVPQLDPRQLREHPSLPPETLSSLQQRLAALQTREANNPFYHWAQAEVLRQMQGDAAAAPAFDRARQTAGPRAMIHWLLWLDFLGRDLRNEALREERALQAIQLTWGLSRFPLLARELIQQGTDAAAAKDLPRAQALFEAAAASAPESPEALIGRASVRWQVDKTRLLQAARDLGRGLYFAFRNVHTGFRLTGNLLLSLLIAWLLTLMLVGAIFSLKAQPLFAHELKEGLLSPFPPAVQGSLGLLAFLLPFFLSLGVLWTAVLALVLSAPYLTRREQWTVSVILAGLAALPLGYHRVAAGHLVAASERSVLSRVAEEGGHGDTLIDGLRRWIQETPEDGLPQYYLGLALKRRGELAQAEAAMARAAQLFPRMGFAQVGLGNLQYLQGRIPEAEATYRRAAEIEPASAAAQMNLGQLYAQRLHLEQSDDALAKSLKLDPHIIKTLSPFHGQGMTGFVIDESVPWAALAKGLAPQEEQVRLVAEGVWGRPLRGVSLGGLPYVALALLVLFWTHAVLRGLRPSVRRCQQCGAIFCPKCQTAYKEKEFCGPCAAIFRQQETIAAFVKIRRIREGEEWLRQERTRSAILGSVAPGGSDLYQGRVIWGLALCLPTVWVLLEGLVLDALTPSLRFVSPLSDLTRWLALLAIPLYAFSVRRSWHRAGAPSR